MEWNMEDNFSMEWNMEWKIFGMEWKKIASMEYGKIVFHSIPYHWITQTQRTQILEIDKWINFPTRLFPRQ